MKESDLFDELFVLELANNHLGSVPRGLEIIEIYGRLARIHGIKAAIKLQIRSENFIHEQFRHREDIRYIKKTRDTLLRERDYQLLSDAIRKNNCIPMATAFDEEAVGICERIGFPILKLASSDINDWPLIERIASTGLPVIASTGGSSVKDTDDLVAFFQTRDIPLALNHCVSLYPTEDEELEMNQIDYLKNRYTEITIGFSTHEYHDWKNSILIAYAKGARTFERHIDIESVAGVSPYCTVPQRCDEWFQAFKKAKELCGGSGEEKRRPHTREIQYLDSLLRGVYAKTNLNHGEKLSPENYYLAVPLLKGQISCRELVDGEKLTLPVHKDGPILLSHLEEASFLSRSLLDTIRERGFKDEQRDRDGKGESLPGHGRVLSEVPRGNGH